MPQTTFIVVCIDVLNLGTTENIINLQTELGFVISVGNLNVIFTKDE